MLNPDKVKLAIAPIGWTNDDMPDLGAENTFEQCISEMALAGFPARRSATSIRPIRQCSSRIWTFAGCKFATPGSRLT